MKRKKLNLMKIKHQKLNRQEMMNVLAGSDGGETCCEIVPAVKEVVVIVKLHQNTHILVVLLLLVVLIVCFQAI